MTNETLGMVLISINFFIQSKNLFSRTRAFDGDDEDGVGPRRVLVHVGSADSPKK